MTGFTKSAAARIAAVVKLVEGGARSDVGRIPGPNATAQPVSRGAFITNGTPDANGNYDAVITLYDPTESEWTEYGSIKVLPANGQTLSGGMRYGVLSSGEIDGVPLFVTFDCCVGGSGSGSGILSPCCPGVTLPASMCLTVSGSDNLSLNGTWTLTYFPTMGVWPTGADVGTNCGVSGPAWWSAPFINTAMGDRQERWLLACGDGSWFLALQCYNPIGTGTGDDTCYDDVIYLANAVCSPFSASATSGFIGGDFCSNNTQSMSFSIVGGACGGGGGGISRASLGSAKSSGVASSLSIGGVPIASNSLLIVVAYAYGAEPNITATYNGHAMTQDAFSYMLGGLTGEIQVLSYSNAGGGAQTGTLTVSVNSACHIYMEVIEVLGLTNFVADQFGTDDGNGTAPDVGTGGATAHANEYAQAGFMMVTPGAGWTWTAPFSPGGQDINDTVSLTALAFTEGYDVLSAIGSPDANLSGVTPAHWAGIVVTYS
jgi:hypothetical protein